MEIWMICHLSHVLLVSLFLFCPWSSWIQPRYIRWRLRFSRAAEVAKFVWSRSHLARCWTTIQWSLWTNFIVISHKLIWKEQQQTRRTPPSFACHFILFGVWLRATRVTRFFHGIWGEDSRIEQTIWRLGIYLRWPMTYDSYDVSRLFDGDLFWRINFASRQLRPRQLQSFWPEIWSLHPVEKVALVALWRWWFLARLVSKLTPNGKQIRHRSRDDLGLCWHSWLLQGSWGGGIIAFSWDPTAQEQYNWELLGPRIFWERCCWLTSDL